MEDEEDDYKKEAKDKGRRSRTMTIKSEEKVDEEEEED